MSVLTGRIWNLLMMIVMTGIAAPVARAEHVTLIAGGGAAEEGRATECKLVEPFACGLDRAGTLYIAEMSGRILAVDRAGNLRRVAGKLGSGDSGDGGPAAAAELNAPHNLLVLPSGDVLIADTMNHRVRKIVASSGKIVPVAGTGRAGYAGDGGPALNADFGAIYCLALDERHNLLYLDDLDNRRIRRIDLRSGTVSTVAGNGIRGTPHDGALAAQSPLQDPRAITVDSKGNLYILERGGNSLRVVDRLGTIKTIVGTGKPGPPGDGNGLSATLRGPKHLTVDRDDNVLIADTDNHVIRKYIVRDGKIVTIAGTGATGSGGLGSPPAELQLNQPHGVYVDRSGTIFICDSLNHRVLRIDR